MTIFQDLHPPATPPRTLKRHRGPKMSTTRLRAYRLAAGLSQADAGKRAGWASHPAQVWSQYENGHIPWPRSETWHKIAIAVGAADHDLSELCTKPLPRPATGPAAPAPDPEGVPGPGNTPAGRETAPAAPPFDELAASYDQGHADGYRAGYAAGVAAAQAPALEVLNTNTNIEPIPDPAPANPLATPAEITSDPQTVEDSHAPDPEPRQLPPAQADNGPANEGRGGDPVALGHHRGPQIIRFNTPDSD